MPDSAPPLHLDEADQSTFEALVRGSKVNAGLPFLHEWTQVVVGWTAADRQTLFQKLKTETGVNIPDLKRHLKEQGAKKAEPKADGDKLPGRALSFEEPKPWGKPVNGEELLDEIAAVLEKYVYTSTANITAMTLWCAMTWLHSGLDISSFLNLTSATRRCGKSHTSEVLTEFVRFPRTTSSLTEATLFRVVEQYSLCLFLDEVDRTLDDKQSLIGLLNASQKKKEANAWRCVGKDENEVREFSTWCPKCFVGVGGLPATILDRSVVIALERKPVSFELGRWRDRDRKQIERIQRQLVRWTNDIRKKLPASMRTVSFPPSLDDRGRDAWEVLLAIADLAGQEWSGKALRACTKITTKTRTADQDSRKEMLIADLAKIFADKHNPAHLPTVLLLKELHALEERPWIEHYRGKPITARGLANQLKDFGINPTTIRLQSGVSKGYRLEGFKTVFATYAPTPPFLAVTPLQTLPDKGHSDIPSVTPKTHVTDRKQRKPKPSNVCNGVTDKTPQGTQARTGEDVDKAFDLT